MVIYWQIILDCILIRWWHLLYHCWGKLQICSLEQIGRWKGTEEFHTVFFLCLLCKTEGLTRKSNIWFCHSNTVHALKIHQQVCNLRIMAIFFFTITLQSHIHAVPTSQLPCSSNNLMSDWHLQHYISLSFIMDLSFPAFGKCGKPGVYLCGCELDLHN